ncbi:hypothetical protein IWX90DRAFT_504283 [Phyllosticta citrichinensis]|uniref:PHD-type domain-containing protein n=1 Tax=Phyllosticta citrichinensis TaxID=1130410 RepID=A0ABR1XPM7_9PEZI
MPRPSRRSTRPSSRPSPSPLARPSTANSPATATETKKEKAQASLDGWVEPPLKDPAASFEDHGFERAGVVAHMQPLGARPTAKDRATRTRAEGLRRSAAAKNGTLSADDRDSPEPSVPVEAAPPADDRNVAVALPILPPNRDEEEDDDYMPVIKKKKGSKKSKLNKKVAARSEEPVAPTTSEIGSASPIKSEHDQEHEAWMWIVIDKAFRGAHELAKDRPKGSAVDTEILDCLHKQSKIDPELAEAIYTITKDEVRGLDPRPKELYRTFKRFVRDFRRTSSIQNAVQRNSSQSSPGPVSNDDTSRSASPAEDTAESIEATNNDTPAPAVAKPHANSIANGMASSGLHSRSGSVSSTSSLSSVDESIAAGPPPEVLQPAITKPAATTKAVNGAKKQAKTKAAKKGPTINKRGLEQAGLLYSSDEEVKTKRKKFRQSLPNIHRFDASIPVSGIRGPPAGSMPNASDSAEVQPPRKRQILKFTSSNGLLSKPALQSGSSTTSPFSELFPPGGSGSVTRATTPVLNPDGAERPSKRQKTSARTKHSQLTIATVLGRLKTELAVLRVWPGQVAELAARSETEKSTTHMHAKGLPTPPLLPSRLPPSPPLTEWQRSENDDFCSACGFSGLLLCCDGCDKAFHLTCCDPPLEETPEERWLCHVCAAKTKQAPREAFSLFMPLLNNMQRRNPTVFALPRKVQDYFEGVRANSEGAYEEIQATRPINKGRGGWDELPDNTKLKDAKGNAVLCSHCGKSSLNKQQIIQCDVCNANWHLECLDPPMANPPPIPYNAKTRNAWACPRHTEHDLRFIQTTVAGQTRDIRVRKPKNPKVTDVNLRRGFKNNGVIEVYDETESESGFSEYDDPDEEGVVFRLPSKGIKLDFIAKVKEQRLEATKAKARNFVADDGSQRAPANIELFNAAAPVDRRACLNLIEFAQRQSELGLDGDAIQTLIYGLTAELPDDVIQAEITGEGPKLTSPTAEEKQKLMNLMELIRRRLGS